MTNIVSKIEKADLGRVERNISLSDYTTYRVGGKAMAIVYPKNTKKLIELLKLINDAGVKYKILGNGSNLLLVIRILKALLLSCLSLMKSHFLVEIRLELERDIYYQNFLF